MGYITITKEIEIEIYADDLDEDDRKELSLPEQSIDLDDPHVEAIIHGLQTGDRESVFQAARNWVRVNSQVCV